VRCIKDIKEDLKLVKNKYQESSIFGLSTNRGIHALLCYRIANYFCKYKVPLTSLFLTRLIQILYSIDIDYRAEIEGGIVIIHGVELVISSDAKIHKGTIIYHQVTWVLKEMV